MRMSRSRSQGTFRVLYTCMGTMAAKVKLGRVSSARGWLLGRTEVSRRSRWRLRTTIILPAI